MNDNFSITPLETSLTEKIANIPNTLISSFSSKVIVTIILLFSLFVNIMVLYQYYIQSDTRFEKLSEVIYSILIWGTLSILCLTVIISFFIGRTMVSVTTKWELLKPIIFLFLIFWTLVPEFILLYSRPGCLISNTPDVILINAWVSVIVSCGLLGWFGWTWYTKTGQYRQMKRPDFIRQFVGEDKCSDIPELQHRYYTMADIWINPNDKKFCNKATGNIHSMS